MGLSRRDLTACFEQSENKQNGAQRLTETFGFKSPSFFFLKY